MKIFILLLTLLSSIALAQEIHDKKEVLREATPEEVTHLIPKDQRQELQLLGHKLQQNAERKLVEQYLLKKASEGKTDSEDIKAYIQKLTDQGLDRKEIEGELENLSHLYFAELQLKNIEHLKKESELHQKNMHQIEKGLLDGKISQDEFAQKGFNPLVSAVENSTVTIENEKKRVSFMGALNKNLADNTYVAKPIIFDPKAAGPMKVMVPKDFSLSQMNNPLCLDLGENKGQLTSLTENLENITKAKKPLIHQMWITWGYNRNYHSKSDIKVATKDGTFMIHDAVGKDRPTPFNFEDYFNPSNFSIPQYNIDVGVMFNPKWGIELSQNHMKWVFDNQRPYKITGEYDRLVVIDNPNPVADWDKKKAVPFSEAKANNNASWFFAEHSDGYNYVSLGMIYNKNLLKSKNGKIALDARFGGGAGLMVPKTKVDFHQDRAWNVEGLDNKFHVAGGGIHGDARIKVTFWDSIFLQAVTRGTYIKVKDALVDGSEARMEHIQPIGSLLFTGQIGYQKTFGKSKK